MTVLLAAVSGAVGVLLGILMLQRIDPGETWDDWLDVRTDRWFNVAQFALIAMFVAGVVLSGELAVALIGVPAGACLVFFTVGVRRWLRRDRSAPRVDYELEEEPQRPLWQRIGLTFAWSAPLGVVMGVLLLDGAGEIVGMVAAVTFVALFHELVVPVWARWLASRM